MAYLEDAQKAHAVPLHSHDDSDRTPTSPRESDGTASTAAGKQTFAERLAARGHGSPKLVAQIPATPVQSSSSLKRLHKKESLRRESAGAAGSHRQGQYSALRTLSAAERAPMSVTESQREAGRGTNSDASLPSFSGMTNGLSPWQVELTERKVTSSAPGGLPRAHLCDFSFSLPLCCDPLPPRRPRPARRSPVTPNPPFLCDAECRRLRPEFAPQPAGETSPLPRG